MLKISPKASHNGFLLESDVCISAPIALIVGKNGAGKSRFFQSLKNASSLAKIDDETLNGATDIVVISPSDINPHYGTSHSDNNYTNTVTGTIRFYEANRALFDQPFNADGMIERQFRGSEGLGYTQTYKVIKLIANKVSKIASELSQDDIKLHFANPISNALGGHDVSAIFNTYVKRLHNNEFNEWRRSKGQSVPSYTKEEFENKFGKEPWIILNAILASVFDGKFHFPVPDVNSQTYDHQTPLLEIDDRVIQVNELSSGERTLLWLALSLFNTQYHNKELLSAPKLLLLDEPDVFLHPKMVEKMYLTLTEFNKKFNTRILLISHSPTTAALAADNSIYLVEENKISSIDRDEAIAELLDGVPQIAIDPENSRQVFVESIYDSQVWQSLFNHLRSKATTLNSKISMTFISSGPKMPPERMEEKMRQLLGITDDVKIQEFISGVNGVGNCNQVYGAVGSLNSSGHKGIKGLVDWDEKNVPSLHVQVFAENYAYAIENVIFDPLCILLQLHLLDPTKYSMVNYCGENVTWAEWLQRSDLLQASLNYYLQSFFKVNNAKDAQLCYRSGITLLTDNKYLRMQGHALEARIFQYFPELNRIARSQHDGELKFNIVTTIMIGATNGNLIPIVIENALAQLQN